MLSHPSRLVTLKEGKATSPCELHFGVVRVATFLDYANSERYDPRDNCCESVATDLVVERKIV